MTSITPFLWFDHGQVEEAAKFYTSVYVVVVRAADEAADAAGAVKR